ncbi:polyprenol monophosphomannose synthase [bacterium]|nr:polyprenol monophosphomannose synthase [bacterium]
MPRTLVVVATYNEKDNLAALVEAILATPVQQLHVLIVDDNSPDGTGQIADRLAEKHAAVKVMHRERKLGLGTAHCAGFDWAQREGYDCVLTMDADFSHDPKYLPALVAGMDKHDVMIGSRYVPGGGTRHWGRLRRFMSWGANAFVRVMLGLTPRDCSGGFRCYRVSLVAGIDAASILSRGYAFQEEMLYRCTLRGARVGEAPIVFENRRHGQTKMSLREIGGLLTTVLRLRWRRLTGRLKRDTEADATLGHTR